MLVKNGIAVSHGVTSGSAMVLGTEDFRVPRKFVRTDAIDVELSRFRTAMQAVTEEISKNEALASEQLGSEYAAIFSAHLQIANDRKLIDQIESAIREECRSPEFAASQVLRRYAKKIENLGNSFLAERAADVYDLEKTILRHLLGEKREELSELTAPVIVLAHNLTPSETANLNPDFVLGFATEVGGHTSHTAILAGALEIPAVVGIGRFLSDVSGGETVIIDGNHGEVIIDPDEATVEKFRDSQEKIRSVAARLESLRPLRAETQDGTRISIMGNIEFPEEVDHCTQRGADGIGLYRTEFLYLRNQSEPSEAEHYEAYRKVLDAFPNRPVVIRTLDLGADKIPGALESVMGRSQNPMLGLRSIRLSLQNLPTFKTQLRALLRAAEHGDLRVMFPLISSLMELRHAKLILADVMEDLEEQGIPFQKDVSVGMMVEVPSAAILAEEFAREVDFFSVGTNDLIQYTLACDRSDPAVANLYRSGDPSILRMIHSVVKAAQKHERPVTICGQMSSDPKFIPLLVGMGLRRLSAIPYAIPELKEVVRSITIEQAEQIAEHALSLDLARDVEMYLRDELGRISPDLIM